MSFSWSQAAAGGKRLPGLRGPWAGLGDCPSSPCPSPSWALGGSRSSEDCVLDRALYWMDTGGAGGTLEGAGLAPSGQCSDNMDELGNEKSGFITSFSLLEYA